MANNKHPERQTINFAAGPAALPYEVCFYSFFKTIFLTLFYLGIRKSA